MDLTQETIDYIAVTRLLHTYPDIVTRRAWSELAEIFIPDIPITMDLRDRDPYVYDDRDTFLGFLTAAVDQYEFLELVPLNTRVYLNHQGNPDAAVARVYISEVRQDRATRRLVTLFGVYHDTLHRINGRWWVVAHNYSSLGRPTDGDGDHDLDVFDFPSPEPF